jgi:hypothetical protein
LARHGARRLGVKVPFTWKVTGWFMVGTVLSER